MLRTLLNLGALVAIAGHGLAKYARHHRADSEAARFVVDVLTISHKAGVGATDAQNATWASHPARRHFVVATERDDPDPSCATSTTPEGAFRAVGACKSTPWPGTDQPLKADPLRRAFRSHIASHKWLAKKRSPVGWWCGQQRFTAALAALVRRYDARDGLGRIPDVLALVDEDTYVNLGLLERRVRGGGGAEPRVWAGCLVRWPVMQVNFTFPFGGWGTFFSRGALRRLVRPIRCADARSAGACEQIRRNVLGEAPLFRDGMSVADLMGALTARAPFCYHADWVVGYIVNYYNISAHTFNPGDARTPPPEPRGVRLGELGRGSGNHPFYQHVPQSRPG